MKKFTINTLFDTYSDFYKEYGITSENFKTVYAETGGSVNDFAWSTFQKILIAIANAFKNNELAEMEFYEKTYRVYGEMTGFQVRFENKKGSHTWIQQQLNYIKYCQLQFENLEGFEVFCVSCCKPCDADYQKKFTIPETIGHVNTIESRCCATYGGHRTTYFPIVPEDPNSLIKIVTTFE